MANEQRSWGKLKRQGDTRPRNTHRVSKQGHRQGAMDRKRPRDRKKQTDGGIGRPPLSGSDQAGPAEGGVSLESSQLGESQAALEIRGREGARGEVAGVRHPPSPTEPPWPGSRAPPAPPGGPRPLLTSCHGGPRGRWVATHLPAGTLWWEREGAVSWGWQGSAGAGAGGTGWEGFLGPPGA